MATYTTYYNLDKYEGTDRPNLRDQYNAAMDKIDNQLHTQAGEQASQSTTIAALQQTQTSQGSTIVQLQSDMSTAQSDITAAAQAAAAAGTAAAAAQADATAAGATASSAAIDAAQALAELEGLTIHHISKENENLDWYPISGANIDTSKPYTVDGVVIEESNGKAFACIHFRFFPRTEIPTSTSLFVNFPVFTLQRWEFAEAGRCYGWGAPYTNILSEVTGAANSPANVGWTLSTSLGSPIPTSIAISGMIMCRLTVPTP